MKIAFELVPRSKNHIISQINFVQENLNFVRIINVPDILRLDLRSYEIGEFVPKNYDFLPHVRAIDFDLNSTEIYDIIMNKKISNILVIKGDAPTNPNHKTYNNTSVDMIKKLKKNISDLKIYAGFDPYRGSLKHESETMQEKLEAGASFLMSQPFFDTDLARLYAKFAQPEKLFLGISPVFSQNSLSYWKNVNKAYFPPDFSISPSYNINLAKNLISLAKKIGFNIYFMPINVSLDEYFLQINDFLKDKKW